MSKMYYQKEFSILFKHTNISSFECEEQTLYDWVGF